MSTQIKRRGGPTAEHATFVGAERELTVDTDKKTVVVHDGVTLGGYPLAQESHLHPISDIGSGSGVIEVTEGGTGSNNALGALVALGAAAEDHSHAELTGFGDTVFVDNDADFQAAYSGLPKTIVLGGGSYSTPPNFVPGINIIRLGGYGDTQMTGDMNIDASSAMVQRTTWQGFHFHGNLVTGPSFQTILDLNFIHHHAGVITMNSVGAEIHLTRGELDHFNVIQGKLELFGTHLTGGGSLMSGGAVDLYSVECTTDSINDILTMNDGKLRIDNTSFQNPTGNGFILNRGEIHINGLNLDGPVSGNALLISGSVAQTTLTLGMHNLGEVGGPNLIQVGGTIIPMDSIASTNSVDNNAIKDSAITTGKIVDNAIILDKLAPSGRTYEKTGVIPVVVGNEKIVILPFITVPGTIRGVRIQSLDDTLVEVPATIEKHEVRLAGQAFAASSIPLGSAINVDKFMGVHQLDEPVIQGEAISINFGALSGSTALNNVAWAIIYTNGSI